MSAQNQRSIVDTLQEYSIPLIAGVVAALVWANLDLPSYEAVIYGAPLGHDGFLGEAGTLHFLVNDVFMALFFGIAAKEIVEACLPGGALNPIRRAINPLLGTLGGVLGPICVYFLYVALSGDAAIRNGWGIPTATDIALAWLVARVAFGEGHPAVSFLLLLAVADDAIGLGIIAVFYPDPVHPVRLELLGLVALAAALAFGMRKGGVRDFRLYLLGPGALSWIGLHLAHLHPALALVPIIPLLPHEERDVGLFVEQEDGVFRADTLNRFASFFKRPVDFGLFFFGLANAGVPFASVGHATWAVFLSLLLGKTFGVFLFSMVGRRVGFDLPAGMSARSLFAAALTAGLGLTVALFVAGVAFTEPGLQGAAKMGALMSAFIAPLAIVAARLLGARRIEGEDAVEERARVAATQ
jgi:NhaA family Na+:H+ antiporter